MTKQKVSSQIDKRGVATVTLNNPEKHNAFDDAIIAELTAAFEHIANNKAVRVMILAAKGKSFSAGADLGWMKRMANYSYEENIKDAKALAAMLQTLNFLPLPTIARVQGGAFGGAVGLVSCCDMAVASPQASFSLSEVKIGIIPATISPYVIDAIGQRAARRYFTTAELFDAQTAAQLGLVSKVVEEEQLDNEISKLVDTLLANSPAAIVAAKKLVFDVAGQKIDDQLIAFTCKQIADIRVSTEGQEGLAAFFEKRKPTWRVDEHV
ncbi:MAG: enoyl-CoA hydratase/isomerase family protein [Desulfuromusa sp.]|nr:enoyl-CoA hydratase/isomerase family protein [Desulfuromusa sp.]